MRRAGVGPWIASAAAALFMLFGAGDENIVWAFQMGFVGSLVFGLTQLLLADHDGPIARRDWLALLAGLAGLLCSGVGVTMVVVVGLATLARRGWRADGRAGAGGRSDVAVDVHRRAGQGPRRRERVEP